MERKEIEDRLNKKLGFKRTGLGWIANEFGKLFESNYFTEKISESKTLKILGNFLKTQNMSEIVFFPDSSVGWSSYSPRIKKSNDPVTFDTAEEAIKFLGDQIMYAVDNYYVANQNIDWILTICHEEDFHISGSKEFVEGFKKKYLF